eukprot:TRINITY_DN85898_c0_g1_i1.p1 TRINITY_DN85898_c0_g1~~TRINITY_DN85898_c0_g1_i1.p1  ORF type:complete len:254 (+),score=56.45 TRINITY_DN85898_c0_g1_i1:128-889(+)
MAPPCCFTGTCLAGAALLGFSFRENEGDKPVASNASTSTSTAIETKSETLERTEPKERADEKPSNAAMVDQLISNVAPEPASLTAEEATQRRDAEDFLEQLLTGGPSSSKKGAAKDAEIRKDPNRALYDAVWCGDFEQAFDALEAGADPSVGYGRRNNCALHVAARTGHSQILGMLLTWEKAPTPPVNARNDDGETPLFGAVIEGNVGATQQLYDARADINARSADGKTVLSIAKSLEREDFVNFLVAGGAVE